MQNQTVQEHIGELIEDFMSYRDRGQWYKLEGMFTETAYVDDKAITDEEPGRRAVAAILYGWRRLIRDLYYGAKHSMGRMKIERTGKKEVEAESEVEASYYKMQNGKRYVLRLKGVYNYNFKKVAGKWKIAEVRFSEVARSFEPIGA